MLNEVNSFDQSVPTQLIHYFPSLDEINYGQIRFKINSDDPNGDPWYERYIDARLGCDMCANGIANGIQINIHTIKDKNGYFQLNQIDFDSNQIADHVEYPDYYQTYDLQLITELSNLKKIFGDSADQTSSYDSENKCFRVSQWGITSSLYDTQTESALVPNSCHLCQTCYKWLTILRGQDLNFHQIHPFHLIWRDWLEEWQSEMETMDGQMPDFSQLTSIIKPVMEIDVRSPNRN